MSADLRLHVAALAAERAAFLAAVDAADPEALARRPAPEAWSPLEVLDHLVRAEGATLDGLERQIAAGDARRDVGGASDETLAALLAALAGPAPIRVPERATFLAPAVDAEAGVLRARFAAFDARWAALAGAFPEALAGAGLIRHPIIGPVTAAGAARFTAAHTARHRGQVARALAAAGG